MTRMVTDFMVFRFRLQHILLIRSILSKAVFGLDNKIGWIGLRQIGEAKKYNESSVGIKGQHLAQAQCMFVDIGYSTAIYKFRMR